MGTSLIDDRRLRYLKRIRRCSKTPSRGFTLLELLVAAAIAIVLMAIALPNLSNSVTLARLRGSMGDLSGVIQSCRSQAIKQNVTQHLIFTTSQGITVAYIDVPGSTTGLLPSHTQVWLSSKFSKVAAPTSTPVPLNAATMWGGSTTTAPDTTDDMCFNSRGIPCTCPASAGAFCPGITNGYAFYFTQRSQWAAVGVSPAGRINTYFWGGSAWAN